MVLVPHNFDIALVIVWVEIACAAIVMVCESVVRCVDIRPALLELHTMLLLTVRKE